MQAGRRAVEKAAQQRADQTLASPALPHPKTDPFLGQERAMPGQSLKPPSGML